MTVQTTSGEMQVHSRTSSLAIVSLVAGILGWTLIPLLGCIVAIITGMIARNEIKDSGGAVTGDGFALAGLVLGWIGLLVSVCGFCSLGLCLPFGICAAILAPATATYSSLALPLAGLLI
jgi:hypothetical protein